MATPEGLEPPTSALGKPCSIRLSYGVTHADLAGDGAAGKRLRTLPGPIFSSAALKARLRRFLIVVNPS